MSNFENPFKDFVFSLPEDKLDLLIECINNRKDYDLYGVTNKTRFPSKRDHE